VEARRRGANASSAAGSRSTLTAQAGTLHRCTRSPPNRVANPAQAPDFFCPGVVQVCTGFQKNYFPAAGAYWAQVSVSSGSFEFVSWIVVFVYFVGVRAVSCFSKPSWSFIARFLWGREWLLSPATCSCRVLCFVLEIEDGGSAGGAVYVCVLS